MRERNELSHGTDSPRAVRGPLGSRYAGNTYGARDVVAQCIQF